MRDNIDEFPSGGVGIKIIGKIADELSYTRTSDNRKCLFIVKYYQKPGLVQPQNRLKLVFLSGRLMFKTALVSGFKSLAHSIAVQTSTFKKLAYN